jgi:hypothetical protein
MKAIVCKGTFKSLNWQINAKRASLRVDCHFNSGPPGFNYSHVGVKEGDAEAAKIGQTLSNLTAQKLRIQNKGARPVNATQNGYAIVRDMNCPALLWEPCFCSDPLGAEAIKNERWQLHETFIETVKYHLDSSALIALVAGHAHKEAGDSGALVYGGGTEAEYTAILVEELASIINNGKLKEDDMAAFQAVPSKRTDFEVWYEGLFTGVGAWRRGRVFMVVRVDQENVGANFKYIIIPKDKKKFPTIKWSESIAIRSDNRPFEMEFPQDIGNFSLHVKSEDNPILTAVNQMY